MRYSVSLTRNARRNVRGILSYLRERSHQGAQAWYQRWMEVLDLLETCAGSCGLAPEDADYPVHLRQMTFKTRRGLPYRAVFIVRDNECLILHVRGPGQDLIHPDDLKS